MKKKEISKAELFLNFTFEWNEDDTTVFNETWDYKTRTDYMNEVTSDLEHGRIPMTPSVYEYWRYL